MSAELYKKWKKIKFKKTDEYVMIPDYPGLLGFTRGFSHRYECELVGGMIKVYNPKYANPIRDPIVKSLMETGQYVIPGVATPTFKARLQDKLYKMGIKTMMKGNLVTKL